MMHGDTVIILILDTTCHHSDPDGHGVPTLSDIKGPFVTESDARTWLIQNHFHEMPQPSTHRGLIGDHPLSFSYEPPLPDDFDPDFDDLGWGGGCDARYAQMVPADERISELFREAVLSTSS